MKRIVTIIILLFAVAFVGIGLGVLISCGGLGRKAHLSEERMALADSVIYSAIERGDFPGAVLCVVARSEDGESVGRTLYSKAYGNRQVSSGKDSAGRWIADTLPMTTDVIFDLASLSKSVGTTLAFMRLVEDGKVRLSDNVSRYIPDFKLWESTPKKRKEPIEREHITIKQLLTHTSGLPAAISVPGFLKRYEKYGDPMQLNLRDSLVTYLATEAKRLSRPGEQMRYSCLNFITLQAIIETITSERLDHFTQREVFEPMQLKHTWYNHIDEAAPYSADDIIAPTELQADGKVLYGEVHDPTARIVNRGVSGNAGLFSTAEDLTVIASMLMNGGVIRVGEDNLANFIKGKPLVRVLSSATIDAIFNVPQEYAEHGRTLGWASGLLGDLASDGNYVKHTGYTGTSMEIDQERGYAVILLTNCVHPLDDSTAIRTRALVSNIVASAFEN